MENKGFFQFEIMLNILLDVSDSFDYLCYRYTANINNVYSYSVGIDFRRLQTSDSDD